MSSTVRILQRGLLPRYDVVAALQAPLDEALNLRYSFRAVGEENCSCPALRPEPAPPTDKSDITCERDLPVEEAEAGTVLGWVAAHEVYVVLKLCQFLDWNLISSSVFAHGESVRRASRTPYALPVHAPASRNAPAR